MKKIEYSIQVAANLSEAEQILNDMGEKGWKLASHIPANDDYGLVRLVLEKEKFTHRNMVTHSRHYTTWNNKKRIR